MAKTVKSSLTAEVKEITPDMAREWLAKNTHNRPLNKDRVTLLASQMRDGEWRLTHQGIAFNSDGTVLTDGQHRLAAIVAADMPVTMLVTQGVDDFDVLDSGRARTAGDVLAMEGISDGNVAAAMSRLIMRYYDGTPRPWARGRKGAILSNHAVHLWAMTNKKAVGDAVIHGRRVARRITGSAGAYGAAYFVGMKWAQRTGTVDEFSVWWDDLETGENLTRNDGRLALASWVPNAGRNGYIHHIRAELTFMLTLRAIEAHIRVEPLVKMMLRDPAGMIVRLPGDEKAIQRSMALRNKVERDEARLTAAQRIAAEMED